MEATWHTARHAGITTEVDEDVFDPVNLLLNEGAVEVSHHLAHALAAAWSESPGEAATIFVLDGMGELAGRLEKSDGSSYSDADLAGFGDCAHALNRAVVGSFEEVPEGARECESVYAFDGSTLRPVFKRWCVARSGDMDYADWFLGPMDSCGAAYSAAAHAVFGDWNSCGKLMGLAPWADPAGADTASSSSWGRESARWAPLARAAVRSLDRAGDARRVLRGAVWSDETGSLAVDRGAILDVLAKAAAAMGAPETAFVTSNIWASANSCQGSSSSKERDVVRACCAVLAYRVQRELEEAVLPLVRRGIRVAGRSPEADTVVVCGGVALNSVLNGRIEAEIAPKQLRVPCAPGDESVALGCAVHAFHVFHVAHAPSASSSKPQRVVDLSLLPYSGPVYDPQDARAAVDEFSEWLEALVDGDDGAVVDQCARVVAGGQGVVFWYEGRSEFGPRALGHRSIVASPSAPAIVDQINAIVKRREDFRPLAPSVLWGEDAAEAFGFPSLNKKSDHRDTPFMSRVWRLADPKALPGCAHVDASARPQTVRAEAPGLGRYAALLAAVRRLTGRAVVLNTSFNTKKAEPIVESPRGAVSSFLKAAARNAQAREGSSSAPPLRDLVLTLGDGDLYRPRPCPLLVTTDHAPKIGDDTIDDNIPASDATAKTLFPARRHGRWTLRRVVTDDDPGGRADLVVSDLDEDLEDGDRTGRGRFLFHDDLQAAIYERADGNLSAFDLATQLLDDMVAPNDDDDDDEVITTADVFLALAHLWRATLIRF